MIVLKTGRELKIMREACRISATALKLIGNAVEPGVTTAELDRMAEEYIRSPMLTAFVMHAAESLLSVRTTSPKPCLTA